MWLGMMNLTCSANFKLERKRERESFLIIWKRQILSLTYLCNIILFRLGYLKQLKKQSAQQCGASVLIIINME